MLPQFYQNHFQQQLKASEYLILKILLILIQNHKLVNLEKLATLLPIPIKFESRRRQLQRFLTLPILNISRLWFPLIREILKIYFPPPQRLLLAIDRTQWQRRNILMVSLIWDKRAMPLSWQVIPQYRWSNLAEQQNLMSAIFPLLKDYPVVVLGDREFGSVGFANWLTQMNVGFCLRQKQGQYIQESDSEFQHLFEWGLAPGISFYLSDVKVTKQKGFNRHDVACSWRRKYRNTEAKEGWYILTNLGSLSLAISAYKSRMGIEAMFKDCKTGGYNLEQTHVNDQRLTTLVLIIAIAYSSALILGRTLKQKQLHKYIGRSQDSGRIERRHSTFWLGLYAQGWVNWGNSQEDLVTQWMNLHPQHLPHYQLGLRAQKLIQSAF